MGCHSRCMIISGRIPDCMTMGYDLLITQCLHDDVRCDDSIFRSVIIVMWSCVQLRLGDVHLAHCSFSKVDFSSTAFGTVNSTTDEL